MGMGCGSSPQNRYSRDYSAVRRGVGGKGKQGYGGGDVRVMGGLREGVTMGVYGGYVLQIAIGWESRCGRGRGRGRVNWGRIEGKERLVLVCRSTERGKFYNCV